MRNDANSGTHLRCQTKRVLITLALALLTGWAFLPSETKADAALAVGLPADVAKQGLAMGYAMNYPSRQAAQAEALKRCRAFKEAPESTRDLCKIVESFRNRCLAIALDLKAGTKGLGWAVAKKQDNAEEQAVETCMEAADKKRREFCRITYTRCDKKD